MQNFCKHSPNTKSKIIDLLRHSQKSNYLYYSHLNFAIHDFNNINNWWTTQKILWILMKVILKAAHHSSQIFGQCSFRYSFFQQKKLSEDIILAFLMFLALLRKTGFTSTIFISRITNKYLTEWYITFCYLKCHPLYICINL